MYSFAVSARGIYKASQGLQFETLCNGFGDEHLGGFNGHVRWGGVGAGGLGARCTLVS